jgi:hypothetical protein
MSFLSYTSDQFAVEEVAGSAHPGMVGQVIFSPASIRIVPGPATNLCAQASTDVGGPPSKAAAKVLEGLSDSSRALPEPSSAIVDFIGGYGGGDR